MLRKVNTFILFMNPGAGLLSSKSAALSYRINVLTCSTFVCPTEIIAFSEKADDFRKIGCEVIAASTDSHFTHLAWINTPRKQGQFIMHLNYLNASKERIVFSYQSGLSGLANW